MRLADRQLEPCPGRPWIMGILNTTPDSFSDGGRYLMTDAAVKHAEEMVRDGADMIDIGAESTRPGAAPVDDREQLRRALPVIEAARGRLPGVILSIDTRSAAVAEAALAAGVDVVNDVSALQDDPAMARVVAEHDAGVILMHRQGDSATMQTDPQYGSVVEEVHAELARLARAAEEAGIAHERIVLDPGIGFGKSVTHNLDLIHHLDRLVALGYPVLLGVSRKSFIARLDLRAEDVHHRLGGSLACALYGARQGVRILRVHDVLATRQMLEIYDRIATGPASAAPGSAATPSDGSS